MRITGLSEKFEYLRIDMHDIDHSDGSEEDVGQEKLILRFRTSMTALINECAKKHMSKHSRVSSYFQLDLDVFKRVFICHGKAVTTNAKRTLMKIGYDR